MIRLKNILEELEIGNVLFGDPALFGRPNKWEDYEKAFERAGVDPAQYFKGL